MRDLNYTEWQLLDALSLMPFIDREEVAFLSDIDYNSVCRALRGLEREKLVGSILHATPETDPSARFYLTRKGVRLFIRRLLVPLSETVPARHARVVQAAPSATGQRQDGISHRALVRPCGP